MATMRPSEIKTNDRFAYGHNRDCVEIVRHTYDVFELTAYDFLGRTIRHRMIEAGSPQNRRKWAIQQAEQWAETLGLWFDGKIYS